MKTYMWALLGVGLLATIMLLEVVSTANQLAASEEGILAVRRDGELRYDAFWKKVSEQAQVQSKYKEDFKDVFLGSIEGRYGDDRAVAWIAESNPTLDSSVYVNLQKTLAAGREEFTVTQETLVDRQRSYRTTLRKFPDGMIAGFLGYPKEVTGNDRPQKDLDGDGRFTVLDFPFVTSSKANAVITSGLEEQPLNVFTP